MKSKDKILALTAMAYAAMDNSNSGNFPYINPYEGLNDAAIYGGRSGSKKPILTKKQRKARAAAKRAKKARRRNR